jgi:hypothetical protein
MRPFHPWPWLAPMLVTALLLCIGVSARAAATPPDRLTASLSVVKRTATGTAVMHDVGSVTAKCRVGEKVTGGGYELQSSNTDVQVFTDAPLKFPGGRWGWSVTLLNDTDASFDITAFAMCAAFTP